MNAQHTPDPNALPAVWYVDEHGTHWGQYRERHHPSPPILHVDRTPPRHKQITLDTTMPKKGDGA